MVERVFEQMARQLRDLNFGRRPIMPLDANYDLFKCYRSVFFFPKTGLTNEPFRVSEVQMEACAPSDVNMNFNKTTYKENRSQGLIFSTIYIWIL